MPERLKRCGCGRVYDASSWARLPLVGHQCVEADEFGPEEHRKYQDCPCGSTLLAHVTRGHAGTCALTAPKRDPARRRRLTLAQAADEAFARSLVPIWTVTLAPEQREGLEELRTRTTWRMPSPTPTDRRDGIERFRDALYNAARRQRNRLFKRAYATGWRPYLTAVMLEQRAVEQRAMNPYAAADDYAVAGDLYAELGDHYSAAFCHELSGLLRAEIGASSAT